MRPLGFYLTLIVVILSDQFTKWSITQSMPVNTSRPVLGKVLSLTHTWNTGGAFSLFQARNGVFIVVAGIAALALIVTYHKYQRNNLAISAALALALGGAIGNLIDRVRFGHVIDFFDIHVWPVFNVADSAITVGILILFWTSLFQPKPKPALEAVAGNSES